MKSLSFEFNKPEQLFGNDAAEDESDDVFESFAIYRAEIQEFMNVGKPLQVVRAYKGEGKSALLRLVESRLRAQIETPVVLRTTGQSVSPSLDSLDSDVWVRAWKSRILQHIAAEIGSRIAIAFSDDATSLVEEAERNGFKAKSLVSSITDRLRIKQLPVERVRPDALNAEPVLKRFLEKGSSVWIFIDDIDQNFRNEPLQRLKLASCFIAARQMFSQIPELRFRLAVRPNTWAIIKTEFEALSHVEQYMTDLPWTREMFTDLLARRIEGFLKRTRQWAEVSEGLPVNLGDRYERLIGLVFETPVPWGGAGRKRSVDVVLHTLSRHRPRWLVELCKVSAKSAASQQRTLVTLADIVGTLDEFGRRRVQDLVAEFKPQCAEIENMIVAFTGQNERYATDDLFRTVENRILQGVRPHIHGKGKVTTAVEVCQFLFQIGFLTARRDHPDGTYEHFAFAERPTLLRNSLNIDEGMSWEIHPVFRDTLKLRDVESKSERIRRKPGPH